MATSESGSLTAESPPGRGAPLTFILVLFIICDLGLLFFKLSDPFDGFHGFQEAWYAAIARNYASHSLLMPTTYNNVLDLNVPPLFSYLVCLSFHLFGPTELAARLVPVTFALFSMMGVYLLGRTLLRRGAGLEAVALFASTPIFLILGRNVQTDTLFVSLSMFSVYFYVRATQSCRRLDFVIAGIFMGTALFSKQFAIIPLFAIILWELTGKERRRLAGKDFVLFLLIAGLVLVPFYGYHLLRDPAYLLHTQLHGSAGQAGLATGAALSFLLSELLWGCSPLLLIGGVAGLAIALARPNMNKALPGLVIGCYFVFYLFLHKHTYYFFGMVPFLSLCFTMFSERLPGKVYAGSLIVTLITATLLSGYQLAGCKYGLGEFKRIGEHLRSHDRPIVMADASFYYNYAPLFHYYADNATLLLRGSEPSPSEKEALRKTDRVFSFSDFPIGGNNTEIAPIKGIRYGVKLGNRVYIHIPPNPHFFGPSWPTEPNEYNVLSSLGPIVKLEQSSFFLVAEPWN